MNDKCLKRPNPFEVRAPTAQRAARRAVILSLLHTYYVCQPEPEDMGLIGNAIDKFSLEQEMTECEAAILATAYSNLTEKQKVDISWAAEMLVAVLWGLGRTALPGFTTTASASPAFPFPIPTAHRTFVSRAKLRSKSETLRYKQEAALWLERARIEAAIRYGNQLHVPELKVQLSGLVEACRHRGYFHPVNQDFPVSIQLENSVEPTVIPFRELKENFVNKYWIIFHRCAALTWLTGHVTDGKWENVLLPKWGEP